jgi:hypothetical protein
MGALVSGSALFLKAGTPAPAGFTKIGTITLKGDERLKTRFDVYQKN